MIIRGRHCLDNTCCRSMLSKDDDLFKCGFGYSTDLVDYIWKDDIENYKNVGVDVYYNDIRMRIVKMLTVVSIGGGRP
jgi:hypothetical protein